MKLSRMMTAGVAVLCAFGIGAVAQAEEKLPPRFTVQQTDYGAVFADEKGMTLYWVGSDGGFQRGCRDFARGVSADFGPVSNDLNQNFRGKATCADRYPLAIAPDDARPVGKWTVTKRPDGIKQWAYDGHPLYRSTMDVVPGDVNATTGESMRGDPLFSKPAYVPVAMVPGVELTRDGFGQYLTTTDGLSLYIHDKDARGKSACEGACTETWKPLLTGAIIDAKLPDWSIITRKDGTRQWAYKGKPLYKNVNDIVQGHRNGENERDWRVALVAPGVPLPSDITLRWTWLGPVYADSRGHSLYFFSCQFAVPCDHPSDAESYWPYWHSFCGAVENCAKMFRPVLAPKDAKPHGKAWSIVKIKAPWSPVRLGDDAKDESLSVWAYRGRPVFTFAGDDKPGKFLGYGFERGTGSFRWAPFGPFGELNVKTQL